MTTYHTDVTKNPQNGDQYDRTILRCRYDDSWITVETPHAEKPVLVQKRNGADQGIDAEDVDDE